MTYQPLDFHEFSDLSISRKLVGIGQTTPTPNQGQAPPNKVVFVLGFSDINSTFSSLLANYGSDRGTEPILVKIAYCENMFLGQNITTHIKIFLHCCANSDVA